MAENIQIILSGEEAIRFSRDRFNRIYSDNFTRERIMYLRRILDVLDLSTIELVETPRPVEFQLKFEDGSTRDYWKEPDLSLNYLTKPNGEHKWFQAKTKRGDFFIRVSVDQGVDPRAKMLNNLALLQQSNLLT